MLVRCGQSPLRWLKKLSMCAWSVGVPGRPWCWAMTISAMNWRVSIAVISAPLSDQATRIVAVPREWKPVGSEQPLVFQGAGEQQLRLRVRLFAAQ